MRFSDLTYSLHTLWAVKARTILTTLGIVIGVMSVVAISSVGKSAQDLILGQITALGTNLITVMPGSSDPNSPPAAVMGVVTTTFKMADYRAIRRLRYVSAGSPVVRSMESMTYEGRSVASFVVGTSEEMAVIQDFTLETGRFFGPGDVEGYARVAVIGGTLAKDLGNGRSMVGETIRIKNANFQVIGVLKEKGSSFGLPTDDAAIIPITAIQKAILNIDYLQSAIIRVDDAQHLTELKTDLETTLRRRHNIKDATKDDFSVRAVSEAISILGNVTASINAFLVLVTGISLVVGGINIMNIMYVAVRERTREIGLRKALGAKPRRIMTQFLIESSVISFSGGLIGLMLGAAIAYAVGLVATAYGLEWNFMISGVSVAISLVVSIGIGLGFGVGPALAAARLDAIEALRYE
jgi:putative ABC transport system permease protein